MALTWIGSEIVTKVRNITGKLTTEDISDADLLNNINDFYQNVFPLEAYVSEFEDWFTQTTADEDGGEYTISQDYLRLLTPMTTMDSDGVLADVTFYQDKDKFFYLWPEEDDPTEARPYAALLSGGKLYLRPEPDDVYTFRSACIKKPIVLTTSTAPTDLRWGPAIAYGTAIEMLMEEGDEEAASKISPIYRYAMNLVNREKIIQKSSSQRAAPRF
jgi:hypothetical protein